MRVFIHGAAATPTPLIDALATRTDLENVTVYHLHTAGPAPFAAPEQQGRFFSVSLFTGPPLRDAVDEGRADFMPVFLSDIPSLFESGLIPHRRGAAPAVAAGSARLLHARHLGRCGARSVACRDDGRRRNQPADATNARQHAGAVRPAVRVHQHRPPAPRARPGATRPQSTMQIGAHVAGPGAQRRDAADGHWRHSRRRAPPPRRQGGSRRPHRDVLRRRDGAHQEWSGHQSAQERSPGPHGHQLRQRLASAVRLRARQPVHRVPSLRSDQRHGHHPPQRSGRRHQFRARSGPLRPGVRRLHRLPHLLRHRWSDGLHPRCRTLEGRRSGDRAAGDRGAAAGCPALSRR